MTFLNIDTDKNGEISKEELDTVIELQKKMDELHKKLSTPNLVKYVAS